MPFNQSCSERLTPLACLGIIVAILIPSYLNYVRQNKAKQCLVLLASPPAGATCPSTDKAYLSGDVVGCAEPGDHLPTNPRFVKGRFQQTFPAGASGSDFPVSQAHLYGRLETAPPGAVVMLRPRLWWKYLVGPALLLLCLWLLVLIVKAVIKSGREGKKRTTSVFVVAGVLAAIVLVPTLLVISSVWGSQTYTFDGAAREVRHATFVAGLPLFKPTVYSAPKALAPVGRKGAVVLVHGDRHSALLFPIDPERLGALAPLHAVLFP